MHIAYNVFSILRQSVHIESITAYDNNVILGTRSGQLIMYSVDDNGSVDMLMFNKNFSKKAIVQMSVVAPEHLLFVLTDNIIHVCDISGIVGNFSFIDSSQQTKGCTIFTLDVQSTKSTTGITTTLIRVCCAIKRRLEFFFWKPLSLESLKLSLEVKDVPKALCWIDNIVCVGFKDEYVIYNISKNTPKKFDLIVTSSVHNVDPCICLLKENILGVTKDEFLVLIDPKQYAESKNDLNKIHEMLDDDSITSLKPMIWSNRLVDLIWDEPYAVGRLHSGIEIRSLDSSGTNKDTLVQSLPELSKVKFLVRSDKGIIFAAATSELWCIRMQNISTQRFQLLQQKKFQLAIELTHMSDEPIGIKAQTIKQIHMRYANELFRDKLFMDAMIEFIRADADPYDVIRLYPNLLHEQPNKPFGIKDQGENIEAIPVPIIIQDLNERELENALLALIYFLKSAHKKESARLHDNKSLSKSLLSIIDTTLLKCYLETNDPLVATLLRLNQCHFEESEKTLKKYNKISELIILYQMNDKHKKALDLLQSQACIEGSSLFGYERTIRYLQELGSAHLPLIFEYSNWVLEKYPIEGLRIFTENLIEVETLPRASVLDFLISNHRSLVIPYLEYVINVWNDSNTLLHNVLIKQYREKIQSLMSSVENNDNMEPCLQMDLLDNLRLKLYTLLKNSNNYSPDVILKDFPTNIMLEERALILGRLKKHEKVLAIYIQILGDLEKATKYCEDNYTEEKDIFVLLLKTILNPLKQAPYEDVKLHPKYISPDYDIVINLLNKYAVEISPYKIWEYLPDDMPLYKLHNYLDSVLRTVMAEANHDAIKNSLMEAEYLRIQNLIREEESKYFEITEFTICPDCKKRFANLSAFVRYPNGEVVHLSCHDKRVSNVK